MSVCVALHHSTLYRYDRPVTLAPHEIRLRPVPHCRTPILGYSLDVRPEKHFLNWQQDVFGNHIARLVFQEKTRELEITVDLVAELTPINPFDFFVEPYAAEFPFHYRTDMERDLAPYLRVEEQGPLLAQWLSDLRAQHQKNNIGTIDFLLAANSRIFSNIQYLKRQKPGVLACEQTLQRRAGSCRDSAWLLAQVLRHSGLASRFISGYQIQRADDLAGPEKDVSDLHAWAEVFIPGAGWIGLDSTSGLLAAERHIPLACTSSPAGAAPVIGTVEPCTSQFDYQITIEPCGK